GLIPYDRREARLDIRTPDLGERMQFEAVVWVRVARERHGVTLRLSAVVLRRMLEPQAPGTRQVHVLVRDGCGFEVVRDTGELLSVHDLGHHRQANRCPTARDVEIAVVSARTDRIRVLTARVDLERARDSDAV